MLEFEKLDISFEVSNLRSYLDSCDWFGEHPQRGLPGSPHEQMKDIWVRFNDPAPYKEKGDWSGFTEEHESVWLKDIPETRRISSDLMEFVGGERLGGVLITNLPAGGEITPHIDDGWHAKFYEKYFISIKNGEGARFCFNSGYIEPEEGEVNWFRNDVPHWVKNNSSEDRIAMIVCIKREVH